MNQEKFDNAFLLLIIASLMMLTLIYSYDVQKLKESTPQVVTITKPEYIYLDCKACIITTTNDMVESETRASRGDVIEPIYEEVIEEPIFEPPVIQPINDSFDIMTPSNFTVDDISDALNTESHQGLLPFASAFVEAEDTYGINALYLMSTIGWESGWGKYHSNTNNIAGWKDPNTGGWRYFNSEYECIMTVAAEVSTLWVDSVGSSLGSITSRYCPSPGYGENIKLIMSERQNKISY